jgi:hypothetical protein
MAAAGPAAGLVGGEAPAEMACDVDQPHVAERLGRVADLPLGAYVVLLAEQAQVVAQVQQPLEQPLGLAGAQEGESNRGRQSQSIEPSRPTRAAVCRSPMRP